MRPNATARAAPASRAAMRAGVCAILALGALPAGGWTPASQRAIAGQAARIAPPDLARQIARHRPSYEQGVEAPFADGDPARHEAGPDGRGRLGGVIRAEVAEAVRTIRSHRPFSEIVYRLGIVSHYLADANYPPAASAADPREASYSDDYLRYLDRAWPRFAVVFYGDGRELDGPRAVDGLVARSLRRGRNLYPSIGEEYRRVGAGGSALFDDRSTAFGVGAVAFSHAVSDVAAVHRYIWIEAGGADPRQLPLTPLPAGR